MRVRASWSWEGSSPSLWMAASRSRCSSCSSCSRCLICTCICSFPASTMARFILDLLRPTPSPDQHADADDDHGRRQPLAHGQVQRKKPKKIIGLAKILDRKPEHSVTQEKRAGDRPRGPGLRRVDPQDREEEHPLERDVIEL